MGERATRGAAWAVLLVIALTAAACASDDESGSGPTTTVGAGTDITLAADGPPTPGGSLTYGLASESDGWDPTVSRWAGDGTQVGLAIFDPLSAYDENSNAVPYLAESFDHNDDFTEWTIKLRPDITFHNGDPLTSAAVVRGIEGLQASPLTKPALAPIETFEAIDTLSVAITMNAPWADFPVALTGQAGVVAAPAQLDDPDGGRNPIGTGPFTFSSWTPDKELIVERNENYWRKDESGTQLPYLDQVRFVPIPESPQRVNAMETGDIDMAWTTDAASVTKFRDLAAEGRMQIVEQHGQTEVTFVMLNLAAPPFDDPDARQAAMLAIDPQQYVDIIAEGVTNPARTLFRPGTKWHSDIALPDYDPAGATAAVEAYEAANGPLQFSVQVLSTALGRQQGEWLKSQWEAVGIEVEIKQTVASTFILDGVMGNYQAVMWAQFGSPDPDYEQVWWRTSSSAPLGELSLNFPRHLSTTTDEALDEARTTNDFDTRKAAYDTVQQTFVDDLPYIYLDYPQPVLVGQNDVRGLTNGPLPSGEPAIPMGGPGSFSHVTFLTQTWLTG